jgi:hypothetical protein
MSLFFTSVVFAQRISMKTPPVHCSKGIARTLPGAIDRAPAATFRRKVSG